MWLVIVNTIAWIRGGPHNQKQMFILFRKISSIFNTQSPPQSYARRKTQSPSQKSVLRTKFISLHRGQSPSQVRSLARFRTALYFFNWPLAVCSVDPLFDFPNACEQCLVMSQHCNRIKHHSLKYSFSLRVCVQHAQKDFHAIVFGHPPSA